MFLIFLLLLQSLTVSSDVETKLATSDGVGYVAAPVNTVFARASARQNLRTVHGQHSSR